MMRLWSFAFLVLAAVAQPVAASDACTTETSNLSTSSTQRRVAAERYLAAVHSAQKQAQAETGRYQPLHELRDLPEVPMGFVPRLVVDQWTYAVWMKDLFDVCGFVMFSDEFGVVYDARPRRDESSPAPASSEG
jgi:hypothetical protein